MVPSCVAWDRCPERETRQLLFAEGCFLGRRQRPLERAADLFFSPACELHGSSFSRLPHIGRTILIQMTASRKSADTIAAFGVLETTGFTPAMVALDAMEKTGRIELRQLELNDMLGVCIKISGDVASVQAALDQGLAVAHKMQGKPVSHVICRPETRAAQAVNSVEETSPLIQQAVVLNPRPSSQATPMNSSEPVSALGFIETQGFTAVFAAIDTACKAANVEVVGKEKLGGGYITIVIRGDVAAVKAAVDAGQAAVDGLGKLIAAHVIPRPSASVISLLPKL